MMMERVATYAPDNCAHFGRVLRLTSHTRVDDIVAANGTDIALDIPGPLERQVNAFRLEDQLFIGEGRHGSWGLSQVSL